jgi:hypothetical protein
MFSCPLFPVKQGVCVMLHCGLAILQFKKYLKAKAKRRRIMETQKYFTMQKYINLQKKKSSKKEPKPPCKIL